MAITDRKTGSVVDAALVTTISDTTAPTVAEINAGTRFEQYVIGDGIDTPRSGGTTDISALSDREMFYIATTIDNQPVTATMWREFDGTDAAWTAFDDSANPPTTQYLVLCRGGFSGASGIAAASDNVDVYTVQVVSRSPLAPDKTEGQRFEVTLAVQGVDFDATVAA